ncbi:AprI/Inh family metalloprotease inhibitor [Pseudochelatococcus sp. G4_1912]|uniref:AprI/Inh family metalloprotease inhibitor n=1 Tax=Pseudochelatococcus sp. G4_1912 TaxID=3114288 RepID=UPI0039C67B3C
MGLDRNQDVIACTVRPVWHQPHAVKLLLALAPALILGACADSGRFSSSPYGGPRVISAPVDDIIPLSGGVPSPEVISAPLPPAGGMTQTMDRPLPGTMSPSMGGMPGQDINLAPAGSTPPGPVASLTPPSTPATPSPTATPSRTAVTGSWKASEAAGGSCRVVLSSSPSLDLYKASSSGCASQDLKSVNAWDLRGNEVYLYARGNVVARLRGGGGNFSGVLAKSGAPVTLTR